MKAKATTVKEVYIVWFPAKTRVYLKYATIATSPKKALSNLVFGTGHEDFHYGSKHYRTKTERRILLATLLHNDDWDCGKEIKRLKLSAK